MSSSSDSDSDIDPNEYGGNDLDASMGGQETISYSEFNDKINVKDETWVIDFDDVEFGKELGRGSFGRVYKGTYLGTDVAIKQVFKTSDEDVLRVIGREINMIMSCRHPNIIQFMGCIKHETGLYIITSFLNNGNLRKHLKNKREQLSWRLRIRFAKDIAAAMTYLHKKGMIHRDLKSKNLLVDDKHRIQVCDFGLARDFQQGAKAAAMTICGSDFYLAPELILAAEYDQSCDVFAFGIVLVEIYSRLKPTNDIVPRNPPSFGIDPSVLRKLAPKDCPPELVELAIECTSMDPDDRPDFIAIQSILSDIYKSRPSDEPMEPTTTGSAPARRGFLSSVAESRRDISPGVGAASGERHPSTIPAYEPGKKTGDTPLLAKHTSTSKRDENAFYTTDDTTGSSFEPPPRLESPNTPRRTFGKNPLNTQYSAAIIRVDPARGYEFFTAASTDMLEREEQTPTKAQHNHNQQGIRSGVLSFFKRK